jgi:hypothetical protein
VGQVANLPQSGKKNCLFLADWQPAPRRLFFGQSLASEPESHTADQTSGIEAADVEIIEAGEKFRPLPEYAGRRAEME